MIRYLTPFVLIGLMARVNHAGNEVPDDSVWVGGGQTVTVNITDSYWSGLSTVSVTVSDSNGTSPGAGQNGSEGTSSTPDKPTCDESDPMTTPGANGKKYRCKDGKMQRQKRDGTWVDMERVRDPKKDNGSLGGDDVVGVPGVTIP